MSEELAINLGRQALMVALEVVAPMLLFGLVTGLVISVLQAVTQIQEATLSFIPKILAVGLALALFMPWMLQKIVQFATLMLGDFMTFIQ